MRVYKNLVFFGMSNEYIVCNGGFENWAECVDIISKEGVG